MNQKILVACGVLASFGVYSTLALSQSQPDPTELTQNNIANDRGSLIIRMIPTDFGPNDISHHIVPQGAAIDSGQIRSGVNWQIFDWRPTPEYVGHILSSESPNDRCFGTLENPQIHQYYQTTYHYQRQIEYSSSIHRSPCYELMTRSGTINLIDRMITAYRPAQQSEVETLRNEIANLRTEVDYLRRRK